jgi:hypothetical protein
MKTRKQNKGPRRGAAVSSITRRGPGQESMVIPRPLSIPNVGVVHATRMRYICSSVATGVSITFQNLLDSFILSTTATAGFQLFDLVKIRAIEIWAHPTAFGSATTPVTALLNFIGKTAGLVGDMTQHSGTSMGLEPAYLFARPAARSLASEYQASNAAVAFNLSVPVGAVIDLHLTFKNGMEGAAPVACASALVAAQVGDLLLRGFDGAAIASTKFQPQGSLSVA